MHSQDENNEYKKLRKNDTRFKTIEEIREEQAVKEREEAEERARINVCAKIYGTKRNLSQKGLLFIS